MPYPGNQHKQGSEVVLMDWDLCHGALEADPEHSLAAFGEGKDAWNSRWTTKHQCS